MNARAASFRAAKVQQAVHTITAALETAKQRLIALLKPEQLELEQYWKSILEDVTPTAQHRIMVSESKNRIRPSNHTQEKVSNMKN